ncbi:glutamate--tRNA ligase family protein, partial [Escherichia coli]|nr:glutamate--tRNA ligase family protein [Escherichia coli]
YRIKFSEHHQTGNKGGIYPMDEFTHCISDALGGITHSLCTLEFPDNRRLYDWVLDKITIPVHPRQYEFSRLNLEYTMMSKRKLNLLVPDKHVEGWDDPRMQTISGLRRRGYTAASIREFC